MAFGSGVWAAIQSDPVWMVKANGWATIFWALNFPVVIGVYAFLPDTWQQVSILYLALVSVYANFASHIAAYQASRVEVRQEKQMKADPNIE